jgi:lipoprotein
MKRQEKMIFNFLALFVALPIITGCTVKSKEQMKQEKMNVSSSTKEDAETVTQKQVNFLKKHESEITHYISRMIQKLFGSSMTGIA